VNSWTEAGKISDIAGELLWRICGSSLRTIKR